MNILFITDRIPFPPHDGGRLRTYNLLKQLALRHNITCVALIRSASEMENVSAIAALGIQVVPMLRPTRQDDGGWQKIRLHLSRTPHFLARQPLPDDFANRMKQLCAQQCFDVAHLDYALTAQCAPFVADLPIVLTQHNVQSQIPYSYLMAQPALKRLTLWRDWLDYWKWKYAEIAWSRAADVIVAVSDLEAAYYRKHLHGIPIVVVPNGVDVSYFATVERQPEPATLLFTGGMNWLPNVDAMRYFCREIFPRIQDQRPDARLVIVGREPTPEAQALASNSITVTGQVPDVRPYFSRATVFVVPLRAGGGTRLKILEAFAAGVPVVSTALGCEGLQVTPGEHLLIADASEDFAEQTLRLLRDDALRARLMRNGHARAAASHDYPIVVKQLEAALELAIARRRRQAAMLPGSDKL